MTYQKRCFGKIAVALGALVYHACCTYLFVVSYQKGSIALSPLPEIKEGNLAGAATHLILFVWFFVWLVGVRDS